jgi:hypothetical protein
MMQYRQALDHNNCGILVSPPRMHTSRIVLSEVSQRLAVTTSSLDTHTSTGCYVTHIVCNIC